jgi:hypothetical protein
MSGAASSPAVFAVLVERRNAPPELREVVRRADMSSIWRTPDTTDGNAQEQRLLDNIARGLRP